MNGNGNRTNSSQHTTCTHDPVSNIIQVRQGVNLVRTHVLPILHFRYETMGQQLVFCM